MNSANPLTEHVEIHEMRKVRLPLHTARLVRRLTALPPGEYAVLLAVDEQKRMTWRVAPVGHVEK